MSSFLVHCAHWLMWGKYGSYLNRDERREVILQAACAWRWQRVLPPLTVRRDRIRSRYAPAAGACTSAGELKSAGRFVHLIRTLLDAGQVPPPPRRTRLHAMLGSEDGGFEPYIKNCGEEGAKFTVDIGIRASEMLISPRCECEETSQLSSRANRQENLRLLLTPQILLQRLITLVCGRTDICMCWSIPGNSRSRV